MGCDFLLGHAISIAEGEMRAGPTEKADPLIRG
jgi:hypothetical protein